MGVFKIFVVMKKVMLSLLLAVLLPLSALAYNPYRNWTDVNVDVTARGGYNFLEKAPVVGGALGVNFYGFRAEIEVGYASFNTCYNFSKQDFCYVSPMFGYVYGFNHEFYAMIGIMTGGLSEEDYYTGEFSYRESAIYGKIKTGCNLFVTRNLFFNLDLSYIVPRDYDYRCCSYEGLNFQIGVGFRF